MSDAPLKREECPHPTLIWGSGAFYLICERCQQFWIAVGPSGDTSINFDQGRNVSHNWKRRVEEK